MKRDKRNKEKREFLVSEKKCSLNDDSIFGRDNSIFSRDRRLADISTESHTIDFEIVFIYTLSTKSFSQSSERSDPYEN